MSRGDGLISLKLLVRLILQDNTPDEAPDG
jgi:hypothetical protein